MISEFEGNDILLGAGGGDDLTGGGGADTFRYDSTSHSTAADPDSILDFLPGTDKIDLRAIDSDINTAGDQAFSWIGSDAFTGPDPLEPAPVGQLRGYESNGTWFVEGDNNGDGLADFVIAITTLGNAPLGTGDFLM